MAEACSNCGAEESVGCELVMETGGMIPPRKFCRRCAEKKAWRDTLFFICGWGFLLVILAYVSWSKDGRILDSIAVRIGLLWVGYWVMIIPHELGHALVARWLGFPNIRIMIGTGRPFWTGEFLSFRWMLCRGMMGGFTFCDWPKEQRQKREALMTAAGPCVSVLAIVIALVWPGETGTRIGFSTARDIFIWSNVWVLAMSLWPHYYESEHGRVPNDGLSLLQLMAPRLHHAIENKTRDVGRRGDEVDRALTVVLVITAGLSAVAAWFIWTQLDTGTDQPRLEFTCFFVVLAGIFLYFAAQPARNRKEPSAEPPAPIESALPELLRASVIATHPVEKMAFTDAQQTRSPEEMLRYLDERLTKWPEDLALLYFKALYLNDAGQFSKGEETLGLISRDQLTPPAAWLVERCKVESIYRQGEFSRAEQMCEEYLASDAAVELKAGCIDGFVCLSLFSEERPRMAAMEKWIRRALELAPQNASVHGTVGSVLVELGRFAEAEPHLQRSIDSAALHDKAIGSYYMALVRESEGKLAEAKRLIEQALVYWSAPWFTKRATKGLERVSVRLKKLESSRAR